MQGSVQAETHGVHRPTADEGAAIVVHTDERRHPHLAERHTERIDPDECGIARVAHGDVPEYTLGKALPAEHTAHRRQTFEP